MLGQTQTHLIQGLVLALNEDLSALVARVSVCFWLHGNVSGKLTDRTNKAFPKSRLTYENNFELGCQYSTFRNCDITSTSFAEKCYFHRKYGKTKFMITLS